MFEKVSWIWVTYSLSACFLYGLIGFMYSELDIEISVIMTIKFTTMTVLYTILVLIYSTTGSPHQKRFTIFDSFGPAVCLVLWSVFNWLQLVGYAFGCVYGGKSGGPSGMLTSFKYTSLLLWFIAGKVRFITLLFVLSQYFMSLKSPFSMWAAH